METLDFINIPSSFYVLKSLPKMDILLLYKPLPVGIHIHKGEVKLCFALRPMRKIPPPTTTFVYRLLVVQVPED